MEDPSKARAWAAKFQRWQGKVVKAAKPQRLPPAGDVVLESVEDLTQAVVAATEAAALARDAIRTADAAARRAGHALIQAATVHRGSAWTAYLAENEISPADARRLMARARTQTLDHRALVQMGVVETKSIGWKARTSNDHKAGRFVRATSEVLSWWRDETKRRPLRDWSREEREAARIMMSPLIDIGRQLGG